LRDFYKTVIIMHKRFREQQIWIFEHFLQYLQHYSLHSTCRRIIQLKADDEGEPYCKKGPELKMPIPLHLNYKFDFWRIYKYRSIPRMSILKLCFTLIFKYLVLTWVMLCYFICPDFVDSDLYFYIGIPIWKSFFTKMGKAYR